MNDVVRKITAKLEANVSNYVANMQKAIGKAEDFTKTNKKSFETVGTIGKVTTAAGLSIAAGLGFAVKEAAGFESKMSEVKAISGASGDEMEKLAAKAREMGSKTKFSAHEAGDAFKYMAMAGWSTDQSMEAIAGTLALAAASGEDLGLVADIVTDGMTAFGLAADQAGRFADVLAATANGANTNVSMLGESFKYVAPVAGALGYSIEDTAVALGLMANAGIKGLVMWPAC